MKPLLCPNCGSGDTSFQPTKEFGEALSLLGVGTRVTGLDQVEMRVTKYVSRPEPFTTPLTIPERDFGKVHLDVPVTCHACQHVSAIPQVQVTIAQALYPLLATESQRLLIGYLQEHFVAGFDHLEYDIFWIDPFQKLPAVLKEISAEQFNHVNNVLALSKFMAPPMGGPPLEPIIPYLVSVALGILSNFLTDAVRIGFRKAKAKWTREHIKQSLPPLDDVSGFDLNPLYNGPSRSLHADFSSLIRGLPEDQRRSIIENLMLEHAANVLETYHRHMPDRP